MYKQRKFSALMVMLYAVILTLSLTASIVDAQAPAVNNPPVITEGNSPLPIEANKNASVTIPLNATDKDGDSLTWSISTKPRNGSASISGASGNSTNVTYTPKANFVGTDKIVVQVKDTKRGSDSITINVTVKQVNNAPINTAAPSISGTPVVGNTLTANRGTWTDETPASLTYTYLWQQADDTSGTNLTDLQNSSTNTYLLTDNSANKYVRVIVTASDGEKNTNVVTGWTTVAPKPINQAPVNTSAPSISDPITAGSPVTATTGTWEDETALTYAYQWQIAADVNGSDAAPIQGAAAETYVPTDANAGKYINVKVTANDGEKSSEAVSAWVLISPRPLPKTISYVALGDSIATGTVYPGNIITSYVTYFKNFLETQNPNVQVVLNNLAVDGYRTNELYATLGADLSSGDSTFISTVQSANIITISIGGNNLMQAAKDDTALGGYNFDRIDAAVAEQGVQDFNNQWVPIINKIKSLNPNSQIIVTTLYNPYNESTTALHNQVDSYLFRADSTGINDVINNNTALGYDVADVFGGFDVYSTNMVTVTYLYPTNFLEFLTRNPHPRTFGQEIITNLHKDLYKPIQP